jgi:hypothetical protein
LADPNFAVEVLAQSIQVKSSPYVGLLRYGRSVKTVDNLLMVHFIRHAAAGRARIEAELDGLKADTGHIYQ